LTLREGSVVLVVETGEPGGEAFDADLVLGVEVDERLELLGQPRQGDGVVTPACGQLLDPSVGEVDLCS
jgi:hypothetical protein